MDSVTTSYIPENSILNLIQKLKSLKARKEELKANGPTALSNIEGDGNYILEMGKLSSQINELRMQIISRYIEYLPKKDNNIKDFDCHSFKWAFIRCDPNEFFNNNSDEYGQIRVCALGSLRYAFGEKDKLFGLLTSFVMIEPKVTGVTSHEPIDDGLYKTTEIFLEQMDDETNDKTKPREAIELNRCLRTEHPEIFGDEIRLLKISRKTKKGFSSFYVLSPVTAKQLEDEQIKDFFCEVYCSPEYLQAVTKEGVCLYAGAIKRNKDGFVYPYFDKRIMDALSLTKIHQILLQLHGQV